METTKSIISSKELFSSDLIKNKFKEILGERRAGAFITSVLQVVASNNLLKEADPNSVYNCAAVAATLDLPLNQSLGFAYIIPFRDNKRGIVVAQFQIGYKGLIQLAQRSGQYETISAAPIYEGQLIEENPLTGFVFDFTKPSTGKVIGYASYIKLLNGFQKTWYMSVDKLTAHGKKYSKSFNQSSSLWQTDPEIMYMKTVLKLLISKFGPMSVDMQTAMRVDQAVINDADTLDVDYSDNDRGRPEVETIESKEHDRLSKLIYQATTLEQLDGYAKEADKPQIDLIKNRRLFILNAQLLDLSEMADSPEKTKAQEAIRGAIKKIESNA